MKRPRFGIQPAYSDSAMSRPKTSSMGRAITTSSSARIISPPENRLPAASQTHRPSHGCLLPQAEPGQEAAPQLPGASGGRYGGELALVVRHDLARGEAV